MNEQQNINDVKDNEHLNKLIDEQQEARIRLALIDGNLDELIPQLPEQYQKVFKHYMKKKEEAQKNLDIPALLQINNDFIKAIQKLSTNGDHFSK